MQENSYAIYQVKQGWDYHRLRFASLDDLRRDEMCLRRDVHKVLHAAEGMIFPDKGAAEQFFRDEGKGFQVIPGDNPHVITLRNDSLQEATLHLQPGAGGLQLKGCDIRSAEYGVRPESYDLVYAGALSSSDVRDPYAVLDRLFVRFNLDQPEDFHGHSLSVSDVIVLRHGGQAAAYYTDSFGFQRLPDFIPLENALRNAEMAMEDDLNMIDGIINNGPKEEKTLQAPQTPETTQPPEHPLKSRHRHDNAR